ncbi:probable MFS transporter [Cephalotrichum gorgonifer]|uniref:Probable MFS transporter n=1 Tax=Cephalotrichum gorgonifer TaxID=2041049 RepID=A0AAE8SYV1_9PEZI|nr:probable MFS transporter [Cephalotrichum gorgonifer]
MEEKKSSTLNGAAVPDDVKGELALGETVSKQECQSELVSGSTAEPKLRLKIDFHVMPLVSIIYLLCFIDRANIGNARVAGLEKDLGMSGYQYNTCLSIFYISYILFEIPLNMCCKWIGPGWFIPVCCIGFGVCTIGTAYVKDFSQLCALRFLLGIFEAPMLPANAYYLSRWYRRSELTFRLSLFIISASLAGAFGGLLASVILRLPGIGSVHSWQMIFLIEGVVTVIVEFIALATLTDRPESAIWLTEEQKTLAADRVTSERIGTTEVIDQYTRKKFMAGITSPVAITTSIIFLLNNITVHGLSFFLPTIVQTIFPERTVTDQQLLTVPPYALGTVMCLIFCFLSWRLDKRGIFLIMFAPFSMIGYSMFLATSAAHVRYAATFLPVCGIFAYGAMTNSHVSANLVSDTARSSGIAFTVMISNFGGLISTWAFLPFDSPRYRIGNGLNLAAQSTIFILAVGKYFWIRTTNKKRASRNVEAELNGLSVAEIQDLDWHHPGFRFRN